MDMVGYIGVFLVVVKVVEVVDSCVKDLIIMVLVYDYDVIVIVDYGNFDFM